MPIINADPWWWNVGCSMGASAVLLGAFGAHGLRSMVSDPAKLQNWATAAHYQLIHSAVILLASASSPAPRRNSLTSSNTNTAAALLAAGNLLFSGSIYLLTLNQIKGNWPVIRRILGPLTPLGGLCYVAGWAWLATSWLY